MKSVVSISAAVLLAMSLTACGNNDEQDNAAASNGEAPETNTASQNSNAMDSSGESQMSDEAAGGSQDDMAAQPANDDAGMNTQDNADTGAMSQPASEDMPQAAVAVLHGTQGNEDASATIRFTPQNGGLAYTTEAEGLAPGQHGYHIHLYGDCSSGDGKSAGTHFNLQGSSKNPPADIDRITGDLGNLDVGEDGSASHEGMIEGASLTGAKAVIGRGIIIHAKANDPSQPPIGAAGSRQACGVIGIAEAQSGDAMTNGDTPDQAQSQSESQSQNQNQGTTGENTGSAEASGSADSDMDTSATGDSSMDSGEDESSM